MRPVAILLPFLLPVLISCTTMQDVEMARAHYSAQQPLLRLTAHPGEQIVMSGVAELVVAAPSSNAQYQQQHHPIWGLIGQALPFAVQGASAVGLARAVGAVARDVTVVEQPAPVIVPSPSPVLVPPVIVPIPPPVIVEQPPPIVVRGDNGL
jgi:hypothetical protein